MTESSLQTDAPVAAQLASSEDQTYAPSFVDRIMNAVKRLPLPYWAVYLVAFLLQSTINHAVAWSDGWLPAPTVDPLLFLFPMWLWFPLALMTYLNSISAAALESFRPLLAIEGRDPALLKYEFVTMPARSVTMNSILWSLLYVPIAYSLVPRWAEASGVSGPFALLVTLEGVVSFFVGSAIYYHSLRQLRLVSRTVKQAKEFDLFRLEPVYAFSRLTARTGIAWIVLFSFTMLVFPLELMNALALATYALQAMLAVAAFVLPLQFVNQRLVAGKRRLLAEHDQRLKSTLDLAHGSIDARRLGDMEPLEHALAVMNAEREVLNRIPTWPWRAGTLRGFLSAIAVPIVLFVIQLAIERWFGG